MHVYITYILYIILKLPTSPRSFRCWSWTARTRSSPRASLRSWVIIYDVYVCVYIYIYIYITYRLYPLNPYPSSFV